MLSRCLFIFLAISLSGQVFADMSVNAEAGVTDEPFLLPESAAHYNDFWTVKNHQFTIDAGSLSETLVSVATTVDIQIIFQSGLLANLDSGAVYTKSTIVTLLTMLLRNTSLTFEVLAEDLVLIQLRKPTIVIESIADLKNIPEITVIGSRLQLLRPKLTSYLFPN